MSKAPTAPIAEVATIERLLGWLSALPLVLIVGLTFADVFARYLFAAPIRGSVEIIEYAMAMAIFTALPLVTWRREHICVSLVDGVLKETGRRIKNVLCDVISLLALGLMTWRLVVLAIDEHQAGTTTLVLNWPHAPLYFAMSVLAAAASLAMLRLTWCSLKNFEVDS